MEGSYRNVSRMEPCLICGKPDWCEIYSGFNPDGDEELQVCRRVTERGSIISPVDGKIYEFIKEFADGSHVYEEAEQRKYFKELWIKNNHKDSSKYKKGTSKKPPVFIKKEDNPLPYVPPLCNGQLDLIYRSFLSKLQLNRKHYDYLKSEGWSHDLIRKSLVKSMPAYDYVGRTYYKGLGRKEITNALLNEFQSVRGVPGFYLDNEDNWTFSGKSGLLIPVSDFKSNIIRLRIRLDKPEMDANGKEKNKYNNFSSYFLKKEGDISLNAFKEGSRSGSHPGVYFNKEKDDFTVCYITEGEKKAILANYILRHPVISLPGVNSFGKLFERLEYDLSILEFMKAQGCRFFVVAYDADKEVNESVLMYEKKLVEKLREHEFEPAIASWNPGFGKGLDDILKFNVRPNLIKV